MLARVPSRPHCDEASTCADATITLSTFTFLSLNCRNFDSLKSRGIHINSLKGWISIKPELNFYSQDRHGLNGSTINQGSQRHSSSSSSSIPSKKFLLSNGEFNLYFCFNQCLVHISTKMGTISVGMNVVLCSQEDQPV